MLNLDTEKIMNGPREHADRMELLWSMVEEVPSSIVLLDIDGHLDPF
jgi:hypothetical protein